MILATTPVEPVTSGFGPADWALVGAAVAGLFGASVALRRGPRETLGFGRRELAGWVVGTGLIAYLIAQPWFFARPESAAEARQVGVWLAACGIEHHILERVGHRLRSGVQAAARDARMPPPPSCARNCSKKPATATPAITPAH